MERYLIEKYRKYIVFLGHVGKFSEGEVPPTRCAGFIIEGGFIATSASMYDTLMNTPQAKIYAGVYAGTEGEQDHYEWCEVQFIDRDDARDICILSFMRNYGIEGFSVDDLLGDEDGLEEGVRALVVGFARQDSAVLSHISVTPAQITSVERDEASARIHTYFLSTGEISSPLYPGSLLVEEASHSLVGFVSGYRDHMLVARSTYDVYDSILDTVYALRANESTVRDEDYFGYDRDDEDFDFYGEDDMDEV